VIPARISGTAGVLPGREVTTAELSLALGRNPAAMERKTGIRTRRWIEPGTRASDLAAEALRGATDRAGLRADELRRLVFVTSSAHDVLFPATANRVAAALGLSGSCDAFDLNNACMGFLTALDLAARSVATGLGPVGIVTVEMPSRHLDREDHRPYLVFGDAAAAVIVSAAASGGVVASALANDGLLPPDVIIEHPFTTGRIDPVRFVQSNAAIGGVALGALFRATRELLDAARVRMEDVAWVVPHQPNGAMLRTILAELAIDPARVVPVVEEIGSVGAASIPFSLDRLLRTRPVKAGDRILFLGVGSGVARGAILYEVGS
jgi:3-oxoacyl-(acyl-carrier-protein) synthase III